MLGNMPQLTGNADKDVVALYDYVLALRRELYDLLNNLDDDNIRQITAKSIATDTLVVGDNIRMGDNAVISWGQVNDAPTVYSADDIRHTIITKEWIGTLGLKVGEQIEMGSNAIIYWSQVANKPYIPTDAYITQITADYVSTPNLITNIGRVSNYLSLGGGYKTRSSVSFDGIGGIDAYDDVLHIGAMAGIEMQQFATFSNGAAFSGYVDFSRANVDGLKARLG